MEQACFHCGTNCDNDPVIFDEKYFCCQGCRTVYEIFAENDLTSYYEFEKNAGKTPKSDYTTYAPLDNPSIQEKLLEFDNGTTAVVNFYIPHIHCSSCIWILENLNRLSRGITASQVNFPKKSVRITFNKNELDLKSLAILLTSIGYEPYISLEDYEKPQRDPERSIIYKLGVAGFAFGNVMLLSFPEYFEIDEFWLNHYKPFFRYIMFAMSLPVVFYAASDYFISAWKGIRSRILNIDVPIALGILVLFIRSLAEIIFDLGQGFFDSLTGLVFFLLLGRFFQQKTYNFLSFERDFRSYFPIGVTRILNDGTEEQVQLYDIKERDRLLIRNAELIPVDSILIKGGGKIDYSFVTGESEAVRVESGEKLMAGGKQTGRALEIEALKSVSQSYLVQLWGNEIFEKEKEEGFQGITDRISKYFTIVIIGIAIFAAGFWLMIDPGKALNVFTAILIIACPCALALSAPFTLGNMLRIFGRSGFYLKNAQVIERLAKINSIVFDKTGTITSGDKNDILWEGNDLSAEEKQLLSATLRNSNHPLSRQLYDMLSEYGIRPLDSFTEHTGLGIEGRSGDQEVKVGSGNFVGSSQVTSALKTSVHIGINNHYKGKYTFFNRYRSGVAALFRSLSRNYELAVLSGDNASERENLSKLLPSKTKLFFDQSPDEKLNYIKFHQQEGADVMMVGDGLNDAGALRQSNVGVAISENVNVFSPACDAILDATKLDNLGAYLKASKKAVNIIKISFLLSFLYNAVGLYFAVTGKLSPVIAAILMPLSSVSVVIFTNLTTNLIGRKLK
ncbi:heavy metal translocating P-type ATPase [Robertkochia solimangrovi]|uniref:heavy metal translocating P-type ATPase n=1 Tax=Robertkochia solimangrovi TaxID=2213046 RepID=UPI00117CBFB7|nr:heavy metal translocating P-type ATPase metal-binding domain-containing protein [Robertkochia solimangrovi]TRZ46188.1 heavy metal translocating P-type ATPase [Robertkochia solimangrovi]